MAALAGTAQRIRVSNGEIAAEVLGDGPPVILTHGAPASSYLWRNVAPVLAQRYTVYAWDLIGYGDSRADVGILPSIALQARTLAELVDHWELETPTLVGHDIGGAVVLRAHVIEGVPVNRLALLDAAVLDPWITPFTQHLQQYEEAYRTMPVNVFADIIAPRMRTAVHREMPDDVLASYLTPWEGDAGRQRWIDQVAGLDLTDTREVAARLGEIAVPTTVLWGEQDIWLDPATADRLAAKIPGARLEKFANAGHFLPEDAPRETADALLRALDGA